MEPVGTRGWHFEYAWMDHIVDAMGKAGIKVILGTPTYFDPRMDGAPAPGDPGRTLGGHQNTYGMRQNMDTDSPAYRFYAERLIRNMATHYKDNPTVIGCNSITKHPATTRRILTSSSASSMYLEKKS